MNILALSGKMGSGKNTVATIINQLTNNKFEEKSFASKLKQIASILTGIPVEKFEDQEFKKSFLGDEWTNHTFYEDGSPNMYQKMTTRQLLQKVGTEAMRNNVHPDVWVNALFADYISTSRETGTILDKLSELGYENNFPNWIISDLRFPNEFDAIKLRDGLCIRINRNSDNKSNHISETSLDHIENWDWVINNNGSIEELIEEVKKMLIYFKLLQ
jgi:hypothetical protein